MCRGQVVDDVGDRPVLELAADLAEQTQRVVADTDAVAGRVDVAQHCSARVTEKMMLRGNSLSSSRNSAALRALGTPR